jgi:bifunctional UDP-N-acetylglucosamine pyrophosphorylase/glucosamine-1-phosphate N-acetyltransferase
MMDHRLTQHLTQHPQTAAVVLAAGRGTRFRSATPKVLHRAAGRSLLGHVLGALAPLGLREIVVVVAPDGDDVVAEAMAWDARITAPVSTVVQAEPRGTGDALDVALRALPDDVARVLVLPGDTPLLRPETLAALLAIDEALPLGMLTAVLDDPTGYGRVVRDPNGGIVGVVEDRDADAAQRRITEINAGMYVLDRTVAQPLVAALGSDNAQGERYLTDVVAALAGMGSATGSVEVPGSEIAGVNDRVQLAAAATVLRHRHLEHLMRRGVSVIDPNHTYVDVDVMVGPETVLLPGTILEGSTSVGEGASIGPASHLTNCTVGDGASVHSTRADRAEIGPDVEVGPFAHLRPGTRLGPRARVGAFVQTKNADVGADAKVPHLAYVGDADVGAGANVACGVVTVNYDGREKHRTVIGEGAFVGCGTMLIAPVTIGDGAFIGAGSTITDDVPADALAIARARQVTKEGRAAGRLG